MEIGQGSERNPRTAKLSPFADEQTVNGDVGLASAERFSAIRNQRQVGEIQIYKQEL
jgi:hypothetical protein